MTRKHAPFQGYKLHQLAKAYIKPEHLTRGLERLRKDTGIEPAVVAYLFQHGRLRGDDASFLLKVLHPSRPKLDPILLSMRHDLVSRILGDLERWEKGEPLKAHVGTRVNVVPPRTLCPKKKQAREKLKADLRAKRGM
tara:strand:- start:143 stop:556 length:414 start_codon:yes stop_codon:yes gene_type:complete